MSSSDRIRLLKAQTLARFHKENPQIPDMANRGQSALTLLLREVGTENDCGVCCVPIGDLSGAYGLPLSNNSSDGFYYELLASALGITIPAPPPGFPTDNTNYGALVLIIPSQDPTTVYNIILTTNSGRISSNIYNLGLVNNVSDGIFFPTGNYIVFALWPLSIVDIGSYFNVEVIARNACSASTEDAQFGCFLEGSPVCMGDGSFKPIEKVAVGDRVRGAFGEINTVMALHRPLLGAGSMIVINGEHSATAHHPHISVDRNFYLAQPEILAGLTYGKKHTVILADGTKEKRVMTGVNKSRLLKLTTGIELQTITGGRVVNTLEYKPMSPMTQVYHLVVSGSHTYIVEGYAVAGWCDESDFNYDTWIAK